MSEAVGSSGAAAGPAGSPDEMSHADQLRAWARGDVCEEAATEMLIRASGGRFASAGMPWVEVGNGRSVCIKWSVIPRRVGALSGGEASFLRLAASLAVSGIRASVSDDVARLDHDYAKLFIAAVGHAAGFGKATVGIRHREDGAAHLVNLPPLTSWPPEPVRSERASR